jgi:hypothetical protein
MVLCKSSSLKHIVKANLLMMLSLVCFKNNKHALIEIELWSHGKDLFGYYLELIISLNDEHVILLFNKKL